MKDFEQQILAGVIILIIFGILTGTVKSLLVAYRCLKNGQAEIRQDCQDIALTLKSVEGRFDVGDQWMRMHQEANASTFAGLAEQHRELRNSIERCSEKHEEV